jgi:gas vesicle protein
MPRPVDSSDLDRLGGDLRQEMSATASGLRQGIHSTGEQIRTDLREEIRSTGDQIRTELQQVVVELRQEIQSSAAQTRRHFDVVGESLKSDIKAVAEGLGALDEKVERFRGEAREDFGRLDRRLLHLEVRVIGRSDPA